MPNTKNFPVTITLTAARSDLVWLRNYLKAKAADYPVNARLVAAIEAARPIKKHAKAEKPASA